MSGSMSPSERASVIAELADQSDATPRSFERAFDATRAGRPGFIMRSNASMTDSYTFLAAETVTERDIGLLDDIGVGPLYLILPTERLEALGLPVRTALLEQLGEPLAAGTVASSPAEQAAFINAVVRAHERPRDHRAAPPVGLVVVCPRRGSVLASASPIEAAFDVVWLAGMRPGAIVRKVRTRESRADVHDDTVRLARRFDTAVLDIADLVAYRRDRLHPLVDPMPTHARLPTPHGTFAMRVFRDAVRDVSHISLSMGNLGGDDPVLARVHSECFTGDILGSLRCDCGPQLDLALQRVSERGRGVVLYLRQEGRGIGLYNKVRAYAAQDTGLDTVEANEILGFPPDLRDYRVAAQMLSHLAVRDVRLMTNNPAKLTKLRACGVQVVERVPLHIDPNLENSGYLRTKRDRMGHMLDLDDE